MTFLYAEFLVTVMAEENPLVINVYSKCKPCEIAIRLKSAEKHLENAITNTVKVCAQGDAVPLARQLIDSILENKRWLKEETEGVVTLRNHKKEDIQIPELESLINWKPLPDDGDHLRYPPHVYEACMRYYSSTRKEKSGILPDRLGADLGD